MSTLAVNIRAYGILNGLMGSFLECTELSANVARPKGKGYPLYNPTETGSLREWIESRQLTVTLGSSFSAVTGAPGAQRREGAGVPLYRN